MNDMLKTLAAFSKGEYVEPMTESVDMSVEELENDTEFMQECVALLAPTVLQYEIMSESFEELDEATKEAFMKVQDYFVGQQMMNEAQTVRITNPKINVVHLNKFAQMARLSTIITLKMARKNNDKCYTKYKMGQKIKKENMAKMKQKYGAKSDRLAKKLWAQIAKSRKASAVVADQKASMDKKVASAKAAKK